MNTIESFKKSCVSILLPVQAGMALQSRTWGKWKKRQTESQGELTEIYVNCDQEVEHVHIMFKSL